MSKDIIRKSLVFATKYHKGQKRKYTYEPYIIHPISVAEIVKTVAHTDDMICAALLHDVIEDTECTFEIISNEFNINICQMVEMLTDVSKKSDGNRFIRRQIDLAHTALSSPEAKTIKLADLIDNTKSIVGYDKNFAKIYLQEKLKLLEVLKEGDKTLWDHAKEIAERGLKLSQ